MANDKNDVNPISSINPSRVYTGDMSKPVKTRYVVICKNPDFDEAYYNTALEAFEAIMENDEAVNKAFWEMVKDSEQTRWTEEDLEEFRAANMDEILKDFPYTICKV